ncbi:hypothetical protein T484DRAFT_1609646, partial [Baffinella frigidus]
ILSPEPKTPNPKPQTQNPRPKTQNPKPKTQDPSPQAPNPKPSRARWRGSKCWTRCGTRSRSSPRLSCCSRKAIRARYAPWFL